MKIDSLLQQEEVWWAQWAIIHWLKEGDKNTKFFHQKATQRRNHNGITTMDKENNAITYKEEEIQDTIMQFYIKQVTTDELNIHNDCFPTNYQKCTREMINNLNAPFTQEEVLQSINHLKGNAAPFPDGIQARFYQTYWVIVSEEITYNILNILNNHESPHSFNKTFITLIPKQKKPTKPKGYRPIALCNVIMKIITKPSLIE